MTTNLDLFGQPIPEPVATVTKSGKKKRNETPKGYAATPGTGPKGETCKTCRNAVKSGCARKYWWKCLLLKPRWTNSYGTDIRLKSSACRFWEKITTANSERTE